MCNTSPSRVPAACSSGARDLKGTAGEAAVLLLEHSSSSHILRGVSGPLGHASSGPTMHFDCYSRNPASPSTSPVSSLTCCSSLCSVQGREFGDAHRTGTMANAGLEKQGCHPFYESVISHPFVPEVRPVCRGTRVSLSCCCGPFSMNTHLRFS